MQIPVTPDSSERKLSRGPSPLVFRAAIVAALGGLLFGFDTVVSWAFPAVAEHSPAIAFGFFAAMMVLQLFFALKIMPETKGGTLEDIEARLVGGTR